MFKQPLPFIVSTFHIPPTVFSIFFSQSASCILYLYNFSSHLLFFSLFYSSSFPPILRHYSLRNHPFVLSIVSSLTQPTYLMNGEKSIGRGYVQGFRNALMVPQIASVGSFPVSLHSHIPHHHHTPYFCFNPVHPYFL